jgi:uncharacterized protein YdcH (DUF465 family)
MDTKDQALIERLMKEDEEFRKLREDHIAFEKKLDELIAKKPQTTELHFEIESLKKQKLMGKDKMERILTKNR